MKKAEGQFTKGSQKEGFAPRRAHIDKKGTRSGVGAEFNRLPVGDAQSMPEQEHADVSHGMLYKVWSPEANGYVVAKQPKAKPATKRRAAAAD
jgi:hypothetical protein